jgi:DNA-binding PadR family transcriptional regulator
MQASGKSLPSALRRSYILRATKTFTEGQKTKEEEGAGMCDMRGMLSFTILWLLSTRPMYGQELATEIGKRRGDKPNPGTIYPALKDLSSRGLIKAHLEGRNNVYKLTDQGRDSLEKALRYFDKAFGEIFSSAIATRQA